LNVRDLAADGEGAVPKDAKAVAAAVLPYLDAAYNLAWWLTRSEHDAHDIVQESVLRAINGAGTFRGGNARAWLLTIVRNASFDWLERRKGHRHQELDDALPVAAENSEFDPQAILLRAANAERVRSAIETLPPGIREVTVLRDMEGMSYKEIAAIIGAPIGTVMSRLSRGRARLQTLLSDLSESSGASPATQL
jgi:RNA polymerase sigma-70 factor (ECF subfamily)